MPGPIRVGGWICAGMMLLYPLHVFLVARADRAFARQHPVSQFDLRTMVIHDTLFGWAGAWGTAVGVVWLAVASGLWIHYALDGRRLGRTSRRPFLAVLAGLLIVGSLLVVEGLLKPGVG